MATSYGYDNIYQLLSATQGATTTESYSYDPVGNRTASLGVASYTTNSSNEMTANSNASYTYDNNGNTLTKVDSTGTTTYTWDFENRLTSVALPGSGGTVSFKYDPFGRRIYKSSTSGTSVYAYDGDNLIEETNSSGAVVARYSQTEEIDEPLAMLRSGATSYYQVDGLDSVTSLSNSAGSIANTYTFDSFGKLTASTGSLVNPFQYTARESDPETGLYYYRARYYDINTGRFNSEDPLGSSVGVNNYSAMGNNPVKYSDAFGLDYNLNYDPATNTLIVTATIGIYGPNASSQLANSFQKSANDAWNKNNPKHGKCNVRFDFTFNYLPNFHQATSVGSQNLIFIEPDTLPFDIQGVTYTNFGYWSQNMLPWDVAHEVGHLLFLPDDYGILSRGNHSGHMMSNSIIRSVAQHEVDSVVGKAPCGCN